MTYDAVLADRLRAALGALPDVTAKRMFGGVAFLAGGHLAVCASSTGGLLVRVEPGTVSALVGEPHVHRFTMRGREMDGWVHVDAPVVADDLGLRRWVEHGLARARSLPPRR